jgi:glycosyltransferase involved in cell wall biosynthesis
MTRRARRLLVVSHASVLSVNQAVYLVLRERGWEVTLVVPHRWRHEYSSASFRPVALEGLEGRVLPVRTILPGRPQRHAYVARLRRLLRTVRPQVAFLEEETYSVPALQWGLAASAEGIPFGVQAAENLDRALPRPARVIRSIVLARAGFVAARSPKAGELARSWGATGAVELVPHGIPPWKPLERSAVRPFTIGFAGRLVPEKGITDLIEAAGRLAAPVRVLLVGDGPLRNSFEHARLPNGTIEIWTGFTHERMPEAYAEMDVLVLSSRTIPAWAEQFGRVLIEALWCLTPVVGSDSGEIPWVIGVTGGGRVYPEGDVGALAVALDELRQHAEEREALARRGRAGVERLFSVDAAADALDDVLVSSAGV